MARQADERAKAMPVANPTLSYWQAHSQDSPIHDHGKEDALPRTDSIADVCIVGSGISGTIAAYALQQQAPHLSIIMLEARQACSGATGRNGGHCRPDSFLGFDEYTSLVGKEQAHKVLLNEWATFNRTREIVQKENIDCDWWDGLTMTTYLEEDEMNRAKRSFDNYRQHTTLRPDVRFTDDPSEARRLSRSPDAIGAAIFPAGSLYPLRFIHGILSLCLSRGNFHLFTHTPVHSYVRQDSHWSVQTSRGPVSAAKILVATNGYSRALLPCLDNFLLSHRAHCSAIIPPENYRGESMLQCTNSFVRESKNYEYFSQRPSKGRSDNALILGGGRKILVQDKDSEVDVYDDSNVNPALPKYFARYPSAHFQDWKEGQGQLTHTWTGIQGYTRDVVPIVGESFDEQDVYLALGHSGHGMARAVTCAEGVARLMLSDRKQFTDEEWESVSGLPSCYRWTKARASRRDVDCRDDF